VSLPSSASEPRVPRPGGSEPRSGGSEPALAHGSEPAPSRWLDWIRRIDAMARVGAAYPSGPYEAKRYAELAEIARHMLAELCERDPALIPDLYLPDEGYVTPKVDVRGAVFDRAGRLLLVREVSDGRWSLPGGWADVGDSPVRAVEREILEESGYEARVSAVIGVFDAHVSWAAFSAYKLVFRGELVGGEAGGDHETDGVGFFARGELPPLSARRTPVRVVDAVFGHWHDPGRATVFE
jgi:ADP-ribose pyrophosphatase YjhB (NUDIX family)